MPSDYCKACAIPETSSKKLNKWRVEVEEGLMSGVQEIKCPAISNIAKKVGCLPG